MHPQAVQEFQRVPLIQLLLPVFDIPIDQLLYAMLELNDLPVGRACLLEVAEETRPQRVQDSQASIGKQVAGGSVEDEDEAPLIDTGAVFGGEIDELYSGIIV